MLESPDYFFRVREIGRLRQTGGVMHVCMLRNCKHVDGVVVISSESSTESDGELPASTGLIFTPTKRPPSPDLGQLQV